MADVACPSCGHRNPLGSNFCSSCGESLAQRPEDKTTVVFEPEGVLDGDLDAVDAGADADAIPGAHLVVQRGPKAGSRIALDVALVTAGRHPESDIFLDDITVSRRHAEIRGDGSRYEVLDVGSLNGTYVNRQRIDRSELSNGDEVQIGKFKLVFVNTSAAG